MGRSGGMDICVPKPTKSDKPRSRSLSNREEKKASIEIGKGFPPSRPSSAGIILHSEDNESISD